jgi:drug/metabolite transporter (DMT)-like permease
MASTSTALASNHRPTTASLAGAGVALAAVVIIAGNYHVPEGENGGTGPGIATGVLCAVVATLLFALVVPRVRRADRSALILGTTTVLSLAIFWSGLTPIVAAATLAAANKTQTPQRRTIVIRWVAIAVTILTVAWTLANSHLT